MGDKNSTGEAVKALPDFPTEITFKAVFRNNSSTLGVIQEILNEQGVNAEISMRESKKSTFISYTIVAVFPSEEVLQETCHAVSLVDGFFTLF